LFKESVVNNVDSSSLRAPWQNGPNKNKHRTAQKHAEQQDVTDIQNILFLCVLDFSIFIVYFRFLKMNSPRNVELLFMFWSLHLFSLHVLCINYFEYKIK